MAEIKDPIRLIGEKHTPIWSGKKLSKIYRSFKDSGAVGESWETGSDAVAVMEDSTVPFSDYLKNFSLLTPPLVKLLDAAAPLSIQVHPDNDAASKFGGISKTEIWYILEAEDGASILYGILPEADEDAVRSAILSGDVIPHLCRIPVKRGDIYMIPPGMIHSLGAGITVLEVQDRLGTTYRVRDIAGNRETHKAESAESVRFISYIEASTSAMNDQSRMKGIPLPGKIIAATDGFAISRLEADAHTAKLITKHEGMYMFCEKGTGHSGAVSFETGDSLYFPNSGNTIELNSETSVFFVL